MAFVTGILKRVELPDGEWVDIRKLSGKQLKKARRVREREAAESARDFGGDVMLAVRSAKDSAEVKAAQQDPINDYDRWEVLYQGVADWSYDGIRVSPKQIDELDDETSEMLAREIITFSIPQRTEDETKNG